MQLKIKSVFGVRVKYYWQTPIKGNWLNLNSTRVDVRKDHGALEGQFFKKLEHTFIFMSEKIIMLRAAGVWQVEKSNNV